MNSEDNKFRRYKCIENIELALSDDQDFKYCLMSHYWDFKYWEISDYGDLMYYVMSDHHDSKYWAMLYHKILNIALCLILQNQNITQRQKSIN